MSRAAAFHGLAVLIQSTGILIISEVPDQGRTMECLETCYLTKVHMGRPRRRAQEGSRCCEGGKNWHGHHQTRVCGAFALISDARNLCDPAWCVFRAVWNLVIY